MTIQLDKFFEYARERYRIFLRRQEGQSKPWTTDDVLRQFRFCNIFREDDATTIWVRENIREPLRDDAFVLPAIAICRWFNRISTLEVLKPMLLEKRWDREEAYELLKSVSPLITAAYLVRSPQGMDKLTGLLWAIDQLVAPALNYAKGMQNRQHSIEEATNYLSTFPCMGDFLAYEVTTDLRFTSLLENAPDILTWANPGPGAARGLGRILYDDKDRVIPKGEMIEHMKVILHESKNPEVWSIEWPKWEMRDVEHTLCEFDKYIRTLVGDGTPKQKFDGGGVNNIKYGQFSGSASSTRNRTTRDPISEAVNRKLAQKEKELEAVVTGIALEAAAQIEEKYKDILSNIPDNFLPLTTKLYVSGFEHFELILSSPKRLPAFVSETAFEADDELKAKIAKAEQDITDLDGKREEIYKQIQELLS